MMASPVRGTPMHDKKRQILPPRPSQTPRPEGKTSSAPARAQSSEITSSEDASHETTSSEDASHETTSSEDASHKPASSPPRSSLRSSPPQATGPQFAPAPVVTEVDRATSTGSIP